MQNTFAIWVICTEFNMLVFMVDIAKSCEIVRGFFAAELFG